MISQEYLECLDYLIIGRDFEELLEDDLLRQLDITWHYLKLRRKYADTAPYGFLELALVSYKLLAQLTNTNIEDIISAAKELHKAKNAGYSGDNPDPWINFRECEKFGIRAIDGVITRLCDKYVRFKNVYRNSELDQVGESAIDTLKDLAAYSLIAHVMLGERKSSVRSNHI